MNCIIPFTKNIKFNSNISEIVSISLEHEYTANPGEILGNFIISGEYKTHEVSVNKEHFEHVLPFSVNLTSRIDTNSVDFAVEDFTYEIVDNDTLKVNIEYSINAIEEKEDVFEPVEEKETFDEILDTIDEELEEVNEERNDDKVIDVIESNDKNITEEEQSAILDVVNESEETFVTYHIHVMSDTDTIDSICTKYNTTKNILEEYNDLSTVAIGEKIIIPEVNE